MGFLWKSVFQQKKLSVSSFIISKKVRWRRKQNYGNFSLSVAGNDINKHHNMFFSLEYIVSPKIENFSGVCVKSWQQKARNILWLLSTLWHKCLCSNIFCFNHIYFQPLYKGDYLKCVESNEKESTKHTLTISLLSTLWCKCLCPNPSICERFKDNPLSCLVDWPRRQDYYLSGCANEFSNDPSAHMHRTKPLVKNKRNRIHV
jgi:hypothetical protein